MILTVFLGLGATALAQLASLFAVAKLAVANGPSADVTVSRYSPRPVSRPQADRSADPTWAQFMRGM
jgi:hypothetical protein